jgi:thiamine biosynthesis lipoprotein
MMKYDEFRAMNTTIQVAAEGDAEEVAMGFDIVRGYIAECEQRFSRFLPGSELTALNRSSGTWFNASIDLYDMVRQAIELNDLTEGLFDPSILPFLIDAGYDRSMDEIRKQDPHPMNVTHHRSELTMADVDLDPSASRIFLPDGMTLDLGGIAKGWIAAHAVEQLREYCSACAVSAGGDFALSGLPSGETDWKISLEDPRNPEQVLAVLQVAPGALATSSVTRRQWIQAAQPRHHIIDPRTGMPAETAWLSVTVWAQQATLAEAFAKSLLITDPWKAPAFAARVPELRFIAVSQDGSLVGSYESKEMIFYVPEPVV